MIQVAWLRRSDGPIGRYPGFKVEGPRAKERKGSKCKKVLGVCRTGPPTCMGAKGAQKCAKMLSAMMHGCNACKNVKMGA